MDHQPHAASTPAGSKSSPAACSAARARSSSAALRRAQIARQRVQIFKPAIDDRFSEMAIVSHSDMKIPSVDVASSAELLAAVRPETEVVGIDEGQFFDAGLPQVCASWRAQGMRVIVAGLDLDYREVPVRADAAAAGDRPSTSPRRWRSAWCAAARRTARSGWSRRRTACWSARPGPTRRAAGTASSHRSRRS